MDWNLRIFLHPDWLTLRPNLPRLGPAQNHAQPPAYQMRYRAFGACMLSAGCASRCEHHHHHHLHPSQYQPVSNEKQHPQHCDGSSRGISSPRSLRADME
ncbi:hypothetical protein E4U10_008319 [Claviceps purpurea]|nr:hypothetical protein E4U10_008319 [Claviceps purpurea]